MVDKKTGIARKMVRLIKEYDESTTNISLDVYKKTELPYNNYSIKEIYNKETGEIETIKTEEKVKELCEF